MTVRTIVRPIVRPIVRAIVGGLASTDFTPLDLFTAGEQGVWLDPSDLSSMFQDSAGTTPAAVDSVVGKINDKSGRGNHFIQATTASKPILRQAGALYYLEFDGVDDSVGSAATVNLSATNKLTVWAGVRKASDAAVGVVVGFGANDAAVDGGFGIRAPEGAATANYGFQVRGTVNNVGYSAITFAAPHTAVLSVLFDTAGASQPLQVQPRLNGVIPTLAAIGSATTAGNLQNATMHVGRRAGTSLPYNGRVYSVIARGATSTAGEISSGETYVNTKTGAY